MENKKRVFSGTRATGRLHIGNYLGAVKGYIELSNNPEYETIYMVMDLHAITTPYDPKNLAQNTKDVIIDFLACGLNPEKSIITAQSLVPEHTYLANLISSTVTIARMQHLPTYKEKVKQYPESNTMALLNYPVLMAADILIYKAGLVPVGIDQEPHLEVAREIARKMNERYGTDFPEPQRYVTEGEYIFSLTGEGKMSKSVEGSYINLTDDLETIAIKLAKVPTDKGHGIVLVNYNSNLFNKIYKPQIKDLEMVKYIIDRDKVIYLTEGTLSIAFGIKTLMKLVEIFEGEPKKRRYEMEYGKGTLHYKDLKEELAEAIYKELKPIQEKRKELEAKPEYIESVIQEGAERARKIAAETLKEVKEKMGLIK